jgi:hypothetical protein
MSRQIKNAMRTAQAVASQTGQSLGFTVLDEIMDMVGDFGDFEGACECQQRKLGYYGGGDWGSHLQDLKARYGRIPF